MRMSNVLIVPATGSIGVSRESDDNRAALYLRDKSRGLDPDRLVRVRFVSIVTEVEIKLAHAKLGEGMNVSQKFACKQRT